MNLPTKENVTFLQAVHAIATNNAEKKEVKTVEITEYHAFLMFVADGKFRYAVAKGLAVENLKFSMDIVRRSVEVH